VYLTRSDQVGGKIDCGGYRLYPPFGCKYIRFAVNDKDDELKWIISCYNNIDNKLHYFNENQKTIAWFGDSIIGNTLDKSSVTEQLSLLQGALVYNCGFGGCRMSSHSEGWDCCSMYNLAEDIYSGDFIELKSYIEQGWQGMPGYFNITARLLSEEILYSQLDYIIISYGTNDYAGGQTALDSPDIYNNDTVCGALRNSILKLQAKCPNAKIIVTSPTYRYFVDKETNEMLYDCNTQNFGNGTLSDFADAYEEVCRDMNVYFLDLLNNSKINELTRDYYFDSNDGTHPNELGRKEIALEVSAFIDSLEK